MKKLSTVSMAVMFSLGLVACGGSSSKDNKEIILPPVNTAPVITISNGSADEKEPVTVSATVTDNGSVASYSWSQVSGIEVEFSGGETSTINFIAPNVTQNQALVFRLLATDNEGAESSAEVVINITQKLVNLTLSGIVTDSPIANAELTIMVGQSDYSVSADPDGHYQTDLAIDDDQLNDFVSIIAQGLDSQQNARLISLLGTVDALKQAAGDDNILDNKENFNLNVTNITTAKAALMLKETLGDAIVSDAKLIELTNTIDSNKMISLAIAIKVAIDKSANNPALALPAGFNNTLELAMDSQAANDYVNAVQSTPEYAQAAQEMLADSNVTNAVDTQLSSTYFFVNEGQYISLQGISNNAGEGKLYTDVGIQAFDWQFNNGLLTLSFSAGGYLSYTNSEQRIVDNQLQQVTYEHRVVSKTLQPLLTENGTTTFRAETHAVKHFPNHEFVDENDTYSGSSQALRAENISDFSLPNTQSATYTLPVPHGVFEQDHIVSQTADSFTFNRDGSGTMQSSNLAFTWQYQTLDMAEGKQKVVVTLANNTQLVFTQLTTSNQMQYYAVQAENGSDSKTSISIGGMHDEHDQFDSASVAGVYDFDLTGDPLNEFWWELWPTGEAYTVSTYDNDQNGEISAQEIHVQYGDWSVSQNGVLSITRWRVPDMPHYSGCFGNTGECFLYNHREWQLFGQDNNQLYLKNSNYFDPNNVGTFEYIYIDSRKVYKVNKRPLSTEEVYYLPETAPVSLTNLMAPTPYFGQTLYGINVNTVSSVETPINSFIANSDGSYNRTTIDGEQDLGQYRLLNDNSLVLTSSAGYHSRYALLMESENTLLSAFGANLWPTFKTETHAQDYLAKLKAKTPAASFADWQDKEIYWVDQGSGWGVNFIKFTDSEIQVYQDETYSTMLESGSFELQADGSIVYTIGNETGTLFISLETDKFSLSVSDEPSSNHLDFNYIFNDLATANNVVNTLNQLGVTHHY